MQTTRQVFCVCAAVGSFFTADHPHAGANIESLAVGLNIDKALFTIVVTGNKSAVANLVKQLGKLVKVTGFHA